MNMKKLLALLLALVMVFSLAACASKDSDDDDKEDKEKTEESAAPKEDKEDKEEDKKEDKKEDEKKPAKGSFDESEFEDAYNKMLSSLTMKNAMAWLGGSLAGSESYDLLSALIPLTGQTEDDYMESIKATVGEVDGKIEIVDSKVLGAGDVSDAEDAMQGSIDSMQDLADTLSTAVDQSTDEDWESIAEELGASSVDEAKQIVEEMLDVIEAYIEVLEDAEIESVYVLTIADVDGDSDETQDYTVYVTKDGKWCCAQLFDSMS